MVKTFRSLNLLVSALNFLIVKKSLIYNGFIDRQLLSLRDLKIYLVF